MKLSPRLTGLPVGHVARAPDVDSSVQALVTENGSPSNTRVRTGGPTVKGEAL